MNTALNFKPSSPGATPCQAFGLIDGVGEAISGWCLASSPIVEVALHINSASAVIPVTYGLQRPDATAMLGGGYTGTTTIGMSMANPNSGGFAAVLHIRLEDGNTLQSQELYIPPIYAESYESDAPFATIAGHSQWPTVLPKLFNKPGMQILEVGSRKVTGYTFRESFAQAHYTGFDIYEGPNVDVVGDAHKLSSYFTGKFDLVFSSAVFEHLAMPWVVAHEMAKLTKVGGHIFVETHYSYSSHERPWHFFQFSELALKILFSQAMGIRCIDAGVSNPLVGQFAYTAAPYLRHQNVPGLFCHSSFLGVKEREVNDFSWGSVTPDALLDTSYPRPK